jgi:hypothetical protein
MDLIGPGENGGDLAALLVVAAVAGLSYLYLSITLAIILLGIGSGTFTRAKFR